MSFRLIKVLLCAAALVAVASGRATDIAETKNNDVANFAQRMVRAFKAGEPDELRSMFDMTALGKRVVAPINPSHEDYKGILSIAEEEGMESLVWPLIVSLRKTGGGLKVMRTQYASNEIRIVVRVRIGLSVDYMEYIVVRGDDNRLRIVDWYTLTNGELTSVLVRQSAGLYLDENAERLLRDSALKKTSTESKNKLREAVSVGKAGRGAEALGVLAALPEPLRHSLYVLRLRVKIAIETNDAGIVAAEISNIANRYGDDPGTAYLAQRYYSTNGNTGKAIAAIDLVEKRIGRDGYTQSLKALASVRGKKFDEAKEFANAAIQLESDLPEAYLVLAKTHSALQEYDAAMQALDTHAANGGPPFTKEDLLSDPDLRGLAESGRFDSRAGRP